jgi:hypothetical protein
MDSAFLTNKNSSSESSRSRWTRVVDWVLSHRLARLFFMPLILIGLIALLAIPLLKDLRRLSEENFVLVQKNCSENGHSDNLIFNIKNINPNNGIATIDLTYLTDDINQGTVELWIASGSITLNKTEQPYDVNAEFRRVPVVMNSPTIFEWGNAKRATYKYHDAEIKIEKRCQGYFYPFDWYAIEFSYSVIDKNQNTHRPSLWCELGDPRFVNNHPKPLSTSGVVNIPNSLSVVLERPIYQKLFLGISMLVGFGCVVWSICKITYAPVDAMESLALLAFDLTVLLAVPSLRGVFVPSNLQFAPLFDFFVVLIWTVGLMALCINIIRHDIMIRIGELASSRNPDMATGEGLLDAEDKFVFRSPDDVNGPPTEVQVAGAQTKCDLIFVDSLDSRRQADESLKLQKPFEDYVPRKAG